MRALLVLACVVAAAACQGGDDTTAAAPDHAAGARPTVGRVDSIDGWIDALAATTCDFTFRCPFPVDDQIEFTIVLESEARCVEILERAFDAGLGVIEPGGPVAELRRLEAEGVIHVDADRARRCLEAQVGCAQTFPGASACREVIEGRAAPGEPCRVSVACAGDAYCEFDAGACPGTCTARKAAGEPCTRSEECGGDGLAECWFDEDAGSASCMLAETSVASGEDEPCNLSGATRTMCPDGLWCELTEPETDSLSGACRSPIAIAAACELTTDVCETGAVCHGPEGNRTCQEVLLVAANETLDAAGRPVPCGIAEAGPPRACDVFDGWRCSQGGVCEQVGDGSAGARCDPTFFGASVPCDAGLYCDRLTRTCEPLRPAGAPCDQQSEACDSHACDGFTGTCLDEYCNTGN